ncbi:Lysophospholipase [Pleurostoma richardsiae]|uniref:Lysophospholipase n=1 Tax=Pleurostoma richardsiae TaxID=41990 RepID=A0AA38RAF6_9PEZI|nr:Lysophospholipase [Pleurostoma richardsiae]
MRLKKHNGIDAAVYELRPEPTTLGGAVNIPSNGLRLLDRLGLYNELHAVASSASHLKVHSSQGAILVDADMAGWSREHTGGYGFMRVLRTDLIHVLLAETKKQNIPVHFDKRMTHITETNNGVTVTFADGTEATADLLLGCDGIHSAVRKLHVNPEATLEYSGISNMFSILPIARLSEENRALDPALHATMTSEGLFGVMPCTASGDHLYWFYSREVPIPGGQGDREGWEAYGKKEVDGFKDSLIQVLHGSHGQWADQLREIIQKTDTIKFYPIYKMPTAAVWSTKRCLIIGDAAHAMQPHVGQGTSMALEDVFLLSRLLENPVRSLTDVFRKYEAIRRPRVEAIARASADNGEMRKSMSPLALKMKEAAIGIGFWVYKAASLQTWGIGMHQKDFAYDVMAEPI